jgi:hypothetical protein
MASIGVAMLARLRDIKASVQAGMLALLAMASFIVVLVPLSIVAIVMIVIVYSSLHARSLSLGDSNSNGVLYRDDCASLDRGDHDNSDHGRSQVTSRIRAGMCALLLVVLAIASFIVVMLPLSIVVIISSWHARSPSRGDGNGVLYRCGLASLDRDESDHGRSQVTSSIRACMCALFLVVMAMAFFIVVMVPLSIVATMMTVRYCGFFWTLKFLQEATKQFWLEIRLPHVIKKSPESDATAALAAFIIECSEEMNRGIYLDQKCCAKALPESCPAVFVAGCEELVV